MRKIISISVQHRWIMASLFVLLGCFGYYSWQQLAIDAYPDIADVTVQVITQVPGLAAEEVEQQIAIPIERALNGLPGLVTMRSRNTFGISSILLVFKDGVDDYWARQRVQERLADVELPFGASPGLNPLTSPTGEIYRYIIEGKNHDLRELTDLNKWVIIPSLKQVTGVADVSNFGGITTQFQIELNPTKLEQYKLSLSEVTDNIMKNNANAGGSMLNRGDLSYVIRGIGLVKDLADLGKIVVKTEKGVPVYLNDIGTLKYGTLERKGVIGYTDKKRDYPESVEGIVQLLRGQNPSTVLDGIHKKVEELNTSILPKGVTIHPFMDRTTLVDTTLNTVSHTLLFGMLLVLFILILFLGSWRGALIVAITIPLALLISFILMQLTNIPANLLSLGAIDFGIIIEGAIITMETILKKREDHPELELDSQSIVERVFEVAKPVFFSTIIIITAYLPLFAFERIEKKLFTPMAFTLGFALIGALLVALLLIPGLTYAVYRKPQKTYKNRWLEKLTLKFSGHTKVILSKPKKIFIPLVFIVVTSVVLSFTVGKDFLPNLDEGSLWLQVQLPPGITLEKAKELNDSLRNHIIRYDEVTYVMTQTGRDDAGTEPFSKSHVESSIGLKPYSEWKNGKTKSDLIDELKHDIEKMPGYTVGFSQPIIDMVMDQMAGSHSDLAVKIFGSDIKETRRITEDVLRTIKKIPGAEDLIIDQEPPAPQLVINANRDKIAMYGLNVSDVAELIEVAIGGKAISQIFIDNKVYDITCRYDEESRNTPEKIGNLMLTSSTGAKIPLSQVADVVLTTGASTIAREMNKRYIAVSVNLRGTDLTSFLKQAKEKIEKEVAYDHEKYSVEWGGQFENQNRAYARLALIVPLALAVMFLLLFGAFGKIRQAAVLMGVIPLALFGGMIALNVRGMTLNVSSAVGFIALFGVSIQNGVIIFSRINSLRKHGMQLKEAVATGARHCFRPVVMTATVAIVGLFPASISTNIGSDVQRPLATVIVYGLLFATIISLYVLPALYYMIEKRWEKKEENHD
ncbi:efflux RND transporter permease subunit [Williamwhitmania taraxaci]|uniref:Cobalt-zinc-cadmium resistance protein CzcA n=1 Tax=Williamwhitmania taraxaci TaxID=1640674 RepID=A0A1G6MHJ7_9BACT|nr:CusA/CzcA family heavy metal efflux RND transporter [Williamwhitmania taraxaci]SDC54737.1 cobalt-zinc-cadmium resistance protein CzcA [Williamwhitmania taraxaci]